jgi:hypothetical protein
MNETVSRHRFGSPLRPSMIALAVAAAALAAAAPAAAVDLPPLTAEDWAVQAPRRDAQAAAVVLAQKAELRLLDLRRQQVSSSLRVSARIKVLDDRGSGVGEVILPHGRYLRLGSFSGRTLLPDGRVVPVPSDARFERKLSERRKSSVTAVAFPAVAPGAILEYSYEMHFDSFLVLEPWYLSSDLPVLHSEVVYHVPTSLQARTWARDPFQTGLQRETTNTILGTTVRAWARDLPAVIVEPHGVPFTDLATQFLVIVTAYQDRHNFLRLMESWESTCRFYEEHYYGNARRRSAGQAKRHGQQLGAGAGGRRGAAERLYRFVRDEIATEPLRGVHLRPETTLDRVLSARRGDYAEKALLLQVMLEAAKVPAKLVWVAERSSGFADLETPNPAWFDRPIVAAELEGGRVFLDPSHRAIGFGQLPYEIEGSQALLFDTRRPEVILLPRAPHDANGRRAAVRLTLDSDGRLTGDGELRLTGQHGLLELAAHDTDVRLSESWLERLQRQFEGFTVADLRVERALEEGELRLRWALAQRPEEVLGDEVTLTPSRPLGPFRQPFAVPAQQRRTPVRLPFADLDEVELTLGWPPGWVLEAVPGSVREDTGLGAFAADVAIDPEARTLSYRRRLEVRERETWDRGEYELLRSVFATAEEHDAQVVALARH